VQTEEKIENLNIFGAHSHQAFCIQIGFLLGFTAFWKHFSSLWGNWVTPHNVKYQYNFILLLMANQLNGYGQFVICLWLQSFF